MYIVNGKKVEEASVLIDEGFLFGLGVFETILVLEKPIFLKEHISRLNYGLKMLNINKEITEDEITKNVFYYDISNCVLKVIATEKNTVITTRQNTYNKEICNKGFSLKLSDLKRNSTSHMAYIKSLNYIDNILEKRKAADEGYDEVLFLNEEEILAEGSMSNIFFIKTNQVYTPSVDSGILNGIVRNWVVKNFDVIEGKFNIDELINADEVFITNSIMGIMKVNSINKKAFATHIITNLIIEKYKNDVL